MHSLHENRKLTKFFFFLRKSFARSLKTVTYKGRKEEEKKERKKKKKRVRAEKSFRSPTHSGREWVGEVVEERK